MEELISSAFFFEILSYHLTKFSIPKFLISGRRHCHVIHRRVQVCQGVRPRVHQAPHRYARRWRTSGCRCKPLSPYHLITHDLSGSDFGSHCPSCSVGLQLQLQLWKRGRKEEEEGELMNPSCFPYH